ncbi:MAG: Veg family protein [Bacilli bacterium]|nr:Veg family protein [Bacilli bacterium]
MNVQTVRENLNELKGKNITIQYNLGRNKYESYEVVIKELYDYIFTVQLNNESYLETKSFSYADIISKTIKIHIN